MLDHVTYFKKRGNRLKQARNVGRLLDKREECQNTTIGLYSNFVWDLYVRRTLGLWEFSGFQLQKGCSVGYLDMLVSMFT
jgi:hypothetical protein